MKTIHSIFTDEEYKKIAGKKKKSGLNWHDFILKLSEKDIEDENQ